MKVYSNSTFSGLYFSSLRDLYFSPQFETRPKGNLVKENINTVLVLENPASCLYSNDHRSSQKSYIAAELLWYFFGTNDSVFISKYAKFWNSLKNSDGTVNSAYGYLIFNLLNSHGMTQYEWAISSLVKDKDSRQAVLHFNLPSHQNHSNKDFVCTMYGIFHIRENKLDFTVSMRSNDVIWGLPTDIAFFATLQSQALAHLKKYYPSLELGKYTHIANSFHVYEHHFELIEKMLSSPFMEEKLPEVSLDLVDERGNPTPSLVSVYNNLADRKRFPPTDPLYSWILENIKIK